MATKQKRINISISSSLRKLLERTAKRDDLPLSKKALEWMKIGAEIEEDEALRVLAEKRDTEDARYVPHDEAWA